MRPLSLYIHVPFCTRRCSYCSFYHVQSFESSETDFVDALLEEIGVSLPPPSERGLHTVFVGGGTPSVLRRESWDRIFDALEPYLERTIEFTVEMNPEDVTPEQLAHLRDRGVNRVSLGIQSMDEIAQKVLKRCPPEQNERAIAQVGEVFDNVSFDVLAGVPGGEPTRLAETLDRLIAFRPAHFSVYCLEPGGDMSHEVERFFTAVDGDRSADEYLHACRVLGENGYHHYEISNFARPGFESHHNRAYWRLDDYIGVGPAAHSYVGGRRFANAPSLSEYLARRGRAREQARVEDASDDASAALERSMLGLRTDEGVPLAECRESEVTALVGDGLARVAGDRLRLTDPGFLVANEILLRLFRAGAKDSSC